LLLLSTLDDASRNAALCANEGMIRIAQGLLLKPDVTATYRIMTIAQSCADTSAHLYTVSESVHALFVRSIEAQQVLNDQAMDMLNKCTEIIKNKAPQKRQ